MSRAQWGIAQKGRFAIAIALAMLGLVSLSARGEEITSPQYRGQDITVIEGEDRTLYEFRQNGELRAVRVVPKLGKPYLLVPADPTQGYGNLERADRWLPQWILLEF